MSDRRQTLLRIGVLSVLLLVFMPVSAQVFKCVDDRGKTTFSDRPCESSSVEEVIQQRSRGESSSSANKPADKHSGLGHFVDRAKQASKKPDARNGGK